LWRRHRQQLRRGSGWGGSTRKLLVFRTRAAACAQPRWGIAARVCPLHRRRGQQLYFKRMARAERHRYGTLTHRGTRD
jgi:hypothetical protein